MSGIEGRNGTQPVTHAYSRRRNFTHVILNFKKLYRKKYTFYVDHRGTGLKTIAQSFKTIITYFRLHPTVLKLWFENWKFYIL